MLEILIGFADINRSIIMLLVIYKLYDFPITFGRKDALSKCSPRPAGPPGPVQPGRPARAGIVEGIGIVTLRLGGQVSGGLRVGHRQQLMPHRQYGAWPPNLTVLVGLPPPRDSDTVTRPGGPRLGAKASLSAPGLPVSHWRLVRCPGPSRARRTRASGDSLWHRRHCQWHRADKA